MHMNISREVKFSVVEAAAAAGQTLLTTDVVDTQGFESVAFLALTGDVSDTSVLTMTAYTNDTNDTVSPTQTVAAVTFTADATNADNKALLLDLHRPRERYVYATLSRGTANAAVSGIIAILYNGTERPLEQHASVIASAFYNDPASA